LDCAVGVVLSSCCLDQAADDDAERWRWGAEGWS